MKRAADASVELPKCPEGKNCYRFGNVLHLAEFSHPQELCPKGAKCYQSNKAVHAAQFSHPQPQDITKKARGESKEKPDNDSEDEGGGDEGEEGEEGDEGDEQADELEESRMNEKFDVASNPAQDRAALKRSVELKSLLQNQLSCFHFPAAIADIIVGYEKPHSLRNSWIPIIKPCHNLPITDTKFGGLPFLKSDEKWPMCLSCQKELTFFFQLRGEDLPVAMGQEQLKAEEMLQMFFCTAGDCSSFDAFSGSQCVRVITPSSHQAADLVTIKAGASQTPCAWEQRRLVRWKRTVDVPAEEDFELYGLPERNEAAEDDDDEDEEAGPYSGEKLSGFPYWVQCNEQPDCPQCQTKMEFIFQVASEGLFDWCFGDCGVGHIFQCPKHKDVVTFVWACS